jgi:hypothetical protein
MVPRGQVSPQWGKPFLHVFIMEKPLEIFFRTSKPISIKLDANHPCIKGIQVYTNKGPDTFQRGDICKNRVGSFEIFSQEPLAQKSSYLHIVQMKFLFKIMVLGGSDGTTIRPNVFA